MPESVIPLLCPESCFIRISALVSQKGVFAVPLYTYFCFGESEGGNHKGVPPLSFPPFAIPFP